ncbi:uncharacterized protein LOC131658570 [Vicia villosa]|uniref:uncharacterized protein LOC131658570 n=1 Tax=Vicia villosa TaxID=3911 RepID=UPI00273B1402|nr:uncharacterized protein LOC131658570 [Vicia villosa]
MEGLTRLVEKVVESEDFKGFRFRDSESMDILQFADDTVIFDDGSNHNLWCLKVVLRGFEIMSGLKVNFFKRWRVVLINYVLNSLPLYSLSFYRVPKKVIKEIRSIHGRFVWRGFKGSRGNHWVSWSKEKDQGGLSIRDVESFNTALLMMWKWRILMEDNDVWRKLLEYRYLNPTAKMFVNDNKEEGVWRWNTKGLALYNDVGQDWLMGDLVRQLQDAVPIQQKDDEFEWEAAVEEGFSVKRWGKVSRNRECRAELEAGTKEELKVLWSLGVPLKIRIFGWSFLLFRMPTREQLQRRNIIVNLQDSYFSFYAEEEEETLTHLFDSC